MNKQQITESLEIAFYLVPFFTFILLHNKIADEFEHTLWVGSMAVIVLVALVKTYLMKMPTAEPNDEWIPYNIHWSQYWLIVIGILAMINGLVNREHLSDYLEIALGSMIIGAEYFRFKLVGQKGINHIILRGHYLLIYNSVYTVYNLQEFEIKETRSSFKFLTKKNKKCRLRNDKKRLKIIYRGRH